MALVMAGCFTGVESTPKITYSDVKRANATAQPSAEQAFLSEIGPQPPTEWQPGKKFYVADPKASIVFSSTADMSALAGQEVAFHAIRPVPSVTGQEVTEIEFVTPSGESVFYRDNLPYAEVAARQQLEVPFTIEMSIVDAVKKQLAGQKYFVVTPHWYTADGSQAVNGLRYVEAEIVDVAPGSAIYPVRVVFHPLDGKPDELYSMYMTVGNARTSTRNFFTLFAFNNPRDQFPRMDDETWDLISHSLVKLGMTRDECRLALGTPQTVGQRATTAGMVEYWSYSDGVYLLFEEGYLSYFRK
ncbi:MAG: hypothetical protein K2N16_09900 [Muribaculaceae bacterium]|nr:hypothetical protein [Muribaculaceae bacterium]